MSLVQPEDAVKLAREPDNENVVELIYEKMEKSIDPAEMQKLREELDKGWCE